MIAGTKGRAFYATTGEARLGDSVMFLALEGTWVSMTNLRELGEQHEEWHVETLSLPTVISVNTSDLRRVTRDDVDPARLYCHLADGRVFAIRAPLPEPTPVPVLP